MTFFIGRHSSSLAAARAALPFLIAYIDMNPTALITGASFGIGEELARLFASHGHDLVLVARSADKLQSLSGELVKAHCIQARVLTADLADPAAPPRIFETLRQQGVDIDVLVNNAGFGARGAYAEIDYDVEARMIQVNVAALAHLTRLFLPGMLARRSGKILNVASTAAYVPGPFMAVYYASKAFVLSFSEALAEETQDSGVTVTTLIPGATKTNFAATAGNENSPVFRSGRVMRAADVARVGFDGLMAGKRAAIAGASNKLTVLSTRLAPRTMLAKIARKLNS
jgi:short-subunit dehydrogenase